MKSLERSSHLLFVKFSFFKKTSISKFNSVAFEELNLRKHACQTGLEISANIDNRKSSRTWILAMGCEPVERTGLMSSSRQIDVATIASIATLNHLVSIAGVRQVFAPTIVNLDAYKDLDGAIDAMLNFRRRMIARVMMAASSHVCVKYLGWELIAICDAIVSGRNIKAPPAVWFVRRGGKRFGRAASVK